MKRDHLTIQIKINFKRTLMSGEPKSANSRASKPMCLSRVAALVFSSLKEKQQTTFSDVADSIVNQTSNLNIESSNDQRTMRRRVYDVLNVLCAAGFVTKDQRIIKFHPDIFNSTPSSSSIELKSAQKRVEKKNEQLVEKVWQILFYKLLFERNKKLQNSNAINLTKTIHLPALFVGFDDLGNGGENRSLDGTKLEIFAKSKPHFFSPMDIFRLMNFSKQEELNCLRNTPGICQLENLIFPNEKPTDNM